MTLYAYIAYKNLTDGQIELKFSMSILETMDYNMTKTRPFHRIQTLTYEQNKIIFSACWIILVPTVYGL